MNVFTGWTGWAIFAVLILCGWLLLGAALAAAWHLTKCAWQRQQVQPPVRDRFDASRERLGDAWPDDLCAFPPCKADYVCTFHAPRGKHHPPPLTYSPVPPTVHDISSLGEWR